MPPLPFHDEASFKTWVTEANSGEKTSTPPGDFEEPGKEELELMGQLKALLTPDVLDLATDLVLSRFVRGYTLRTFVAAPDRVERTAVMVQLSLEWRKQIDMAGLPDKKLPRRAEWDKAWPQTFDGETSKGQTIWYMMVPTNFASSFKPEETALLHAQDMATLSRTKIELMATKGRKFTGNHHALVVDMNSDRGAVSKSFMKYFKSCVLHPKGPNKTQHFFPDALSGAFIVNTPMMYRALWGFAKMFIEPDTAKKFQMLGYSFLDELKAGGVEIAGLPMCIGGEGPNPAGFKAKVEGGVGRRKSHQIKLTPKKKAAKLAWFFEVSKNITFKICCCGGTEQLERGAVDSKKKGVIDLDPAKDYGTFVFELENKDHKSVAVSYIIDLLND
jgi:hypothetical protein